MTTRTMTALEHKLLAALWRLAMRQTRDAYGVVAECQICGQFWRVYDDGTGYGPVKHLVQHAPGCALFGLDPALLAGLDEFDRVTP